MARNDYAEERPGADAPSADGLAGDLKLLLDQLAVQITDADQRHSDTVHGMQSRLAALSDRAAAAKPEVLQDCSDAFGRVENAMAALADRLSTVEPAQRRDAPGEDGQALPEEVRAEVRRAIHAGPQDTVGAPPVLRSALSGTTAATTAPHAEAAPKWAIGDTGEEIAAAGSRVAPTSPSRSAFDKGWDDPTAQPPPRVFRASSDAPPALASSATHVHAHTDPAWLEASLADIAGRVEQSVARLDPHNSLLALGERFGQLERRFDVALEHLTTPAGTSLTALNALEKQITDLFGELGRAQQQLGRLDSIESRLTELRQSPSEQQMTRLISALAPNDKHLAVVAEAAAERVAERIRATMPQSATPAVDGAALGSLTTLMQEFIGERRQGDAQTAEALDTMQLAMQHLIDRVEAIEAAQASGHDELLRATQAMPARRTERSREPLELGVRDSKLTPAAVSSGSEELPRLAVTGPSAPTADEPAPFDALMAAPPVPRFDHERPSPIREPVAELSAAADRPTLDGRPLDASGGDMDRAAMIAMARRAADKAARVGAPASVAPAADASSGPIDWLRRVASAGAQRDAADGAQRPGILLIATFVAFLLAGFWMVAGTGLRGYLVGAIGELPAARQVSPFATAPLPTTDRAPPRTPSSADEQDPPVVSTAYRAESRPAAPSGRVADGIGIVVDTGHRTDNPAAMQRAAEQARVANLSERLGQERQAPVTTTAALPSPDTTVGTPGLAARPSGAVSRSVEMPPAMLGPLSLRHAAANGDANAQLEIAARYAEGKGVPQDFEQAAVWYQRAAAHGHATAQYRLGALYERGVGVQADPARARVWYGRAAAQGNVRAMHNLAVLSAGRAGNSPDYPSAVQWFAEAASRGLADSQYNLGILYESGLGVPASLTDAYKWYSLAARSGDKDAIRRRDAVRTRLDSAALNATDKVIIDWRAKPTEAAANDARAAGQIWRNQPSTQATR